MALPLIDRGHDIYMISKKASSFDHFYKAVFRYSHIDQCLEAIRLIEPYVDIFHAQNEPSWFVMAVKEITDKPVVLDVHDTYLTRSTPEEATAALDDGKPHLRITAEERAAFQMADALNFVSDAVRDVTVSEFALEQPNNVLPSFVPKSLYKYHFKEWMGGLVYEGRVTTPGDHEGLKGGTGAHYCDYLDFAKKAHDMGMDFHLYSGRNDDKFKELYGPYSFVHPGYAYDNLLDQISRHDWGLVGNTIDSPQWQQTLSNKMFDYLAAGVPVACINASESSKLVEKYGIGITFENVEELGAHWSRHRACRERVIKYRQRLSMDANIQSLLDLYQEVL